MEETMGRLKSHEERIRGPLETSGNQLLLTDGQLLLNREEWLKKVSPNLKGKRDNEFRNKDGNQGNRDKSKVRCFNAVFWDTMPLNVENLNVKRTKTRS